MRTIILRSVQALVSLSAILVLTGANGKGCGGTVSTGGTGGSSTGTACPDGQVAQWVCGGITQPDPGMVIAGKGSGTAQPAMPPPPCQGPNCASSSPPSPPVGTGPGCPPPCQGADCPPAPGCVLQCVPASDTCPAGFHEETVCGGTAGGPNMVPPSMGSGGSGMTPPGMGSGIPGMTPPSMGSGGTAGGPNMPPPPPPPGTGTGPGMPPPDGCSTVCVPDNACPPGTVQQTVCGGGGTGTGTPGGEPVPAIAQCWNECVPVAPVCPPGTHQVVNCPPPGVGAPCLMTCENDTPKPI